MYNNATQTNYGEYTVYEVWISSYAGCQVHEAKNPYWFMGLWPNTNFCFIVTLFVGLTICFVGKAVWEFTNFVAGFGLGLTILLTILYPAFAEGKGYQMNWQMWGCYPLSFFFAFMLGVLLTKIPQYACWWLGFWIAYEVASNIFYNIPFSFINTNTMAWYWIIIALTELGALFFFVKTRKNFKHDKSFHLVWEAPVFGGFLLGLCWIILDKNAPHSVEYAIIRMKLGDMYNPGEGYIWALLTWLAAAALGFISHIKLVPKLLPVLDAKFRTSKTNEDDDDDDDSDDTETLRSTQTN